MEAESFPIKGYRYKSGWLGTPYDLGEIEPSLEIDGETLCAKSEFHMSIFSVKKYIPLIAQKTGKSEAEAEQQVINEAGRLLQTHPVTVGELLNEFRLAEEGKRS
jgi:hypothetical protein